MSENPFEVLKLDPNATEEEIVQQAGRLRQQTTNEQELTAIRQAVQALTSGDEERALLRLFTHPQPDHDGSAVENLANAFRRPPQASASQDVPECSALDLEALAEIMKPFVVRELRPEKLPLEPAAIEETPKEIERQTIEAMWQALPFDPRA